MTYEEAIDKLKDRYLGMSCYATIEECKADNTALDMAIEALEKQIPKKPKCRLYHSDAKCPVCNTLTVFELKYCHECGQALDWSDDE